MNNLLEFTQIATEYPIGTRLILKDDYPGDSHVVKGYTYFSRSGYLNFEDGGKINMDRLELVERKE